MYSIRHHGAVSGVTGSCHQLTLDEGGSILIDCGLFQGAEAFDRESANPDFGRKQIDFDISDVNALLVTHCHIDHVGRIPYLLAAGFFDSDNPGQSDKVDIRAGIYTLSGYSAHADQAGLLNFVK